MSTGLPVSRPIASNPGYAGILKQQELFAGADDDATSNRINSSFDRLMLQSGVGLTPMTVLMLCCLSGLIVGGLILVMQENPMTASFGLVLGAILPLAWVMIARVRRQREMTRQLPGMIEELARAAKTGRSIEQCWAMVAHDTPRPLGSEMQICSRRMQMGQDVASAIHDLPYRTGLVSLNILTTAMSVHQRSGGDLVSVLERLARTIRDRLLYLGRLRAVTIGSRWTAILMLILPPLIVFFFMLRDPTYLTQLLSTFGGRMITITAIGLQLVGSLWVLAVLRNSQRS